MMVSQVEVKDRNASPSWFGIDFQVHAGMMILLENIKVASSVRVEGQTEDIEVELDDGRTIYAQAKSCTDSYDSSNALRDLHKALESLFDAQRSRNNVSLIFVTNRKDPFADNFTKGSFAGDYSIRQYSELPQTCANKIKEYCRTKGMSLNTGAFSVVTFDFDGNGTNRYRIVRQEIARFLVSLDCQMDGYDSKLLARWYEMFTKNGSQLELRVKLSKKDLIWPLILWLCKKRGVLSNTAFDEADMEAVRDEYAKLIEEEGERFGLVTKVMTEYELYRSQHQNLQGDEAKVRFVKDKESLIEEMIPLTAISNEHIRLLRASIIDNIISSRYKIRKIKEAVNL